jgi:hypothetical protein
MGFGIDSVEMNSASLSTAVGMNELEEHGPWEALACAILAACMTESDR